VRLELRLVVIGFTLLVYASLALGDAQVIAFGGSGKNGSTVAVGIYVDYSQAIIKLTAPSEIFSLALIFE